MFLSILSYQIRWEMHMLGIPLVPIVLTFWFFCRTKYRIVGYWFMSHEFTIISFGDTWPNLLACMFLFFLSVTYHAVYSCFMPIVCSDMLLSWAPSMVLLKLFIKGKWLIGKNNTKRLLDASLGSSQVFSFLRYVILNQTEISK